MRSQIRRSVRGGMLYAGGFGDWFIFQMAKRSGGVHQNIG
jgi:hypothetical protein